MIKIGDLVRSVSSGILVNSSRVGVVTEITHKKCWRTKLLGEAVDWSTVEPEPHAVVMFNNSILTVPCSDLEIAN